ncbi:hypothetical protein ASD80_17860 [Devosia sp. Root635]|nr:hypothetical protein ASD80_17860 [Devosia sp. Root635]
MMHGQIGPVAQAHAFRVERQAGCGKQAGEEASKPGQETGHFVTSFRSRQMVMGCSCASGAGPAMDKVAAAL